MRWFKCLVLCVGHIFVNISLAFIVVSDESLENSRNHHVMWWIFVTLGSSIGVVTFATYLIMLPILQCLKNNKIRAHVVILCVSMLYFISFSGMLYGMQHMFVQTTIMQCYAVSGQIGLVFGLLVL